MVACGVVKYRIVECGIVNPTADRNGCGTAKENGQHTTLTQAFTHSGMVGLRDSKSKERKRTHPTNHKKRKQRKVGGHAQKKRPGKNHTAKRKTAVMCLVVFVLV